MQLGLRRNKRRSNVEVFLSNSQASSKRKILTATLLLVLLILALFGTLLTSCVRAQYTPPRPPESYENGIEVSLISPQQGARYYEAVPITVTAAYTRQEELAFLHFYCSVDGTILGEEGEQIDRTFKTQLELPAGEHRLRFAVDAITKDQKAFIDRTGMSLFFDVPTGWVEVSFFIESPSVQILSTKNTTLNEDFQFALRVVGRTLSWAGYSLDGKENVTINQEILVQSPLTPLAKTWIGNLTLIGLSSGLHSLVVYAKDQTGNTGASATEEFSVEESMAAKETQAASFPTTLVAVSVVVAVVSLCLVAYSLRRKGKRSET